LPTVLFVNRYLHEGVTVCDVSVFAAMIEEAYHTPGALHMLPDLDEHGNQQCTGIGSTGTSKRLAASERKCLPSAGGTCPPTPKSAGSCSHRNPTASGCAR
jgi:hypothetical protein